MLTVFHIISRLDIGGAERVALNIAKSESTDITYHIVEVAKADSQYTDQFIKEAKSFNIKIHRSPIKNVKFAMIFLPTRLKKLIKDCSPDIIHTHTEVPDMGLYLTSLYPFSGLSRCHIVRTVHNNQIWNSWKRVGKLVETFMQSKAKIVTISQSTQNSYKEAYSKDCNIIYNGVEVPKQIQADNIRKDRINILFAGRMEYQKGIDTMIEVISHFGYDERFQFHIVGVGTECEKVRQKLGNYSNIKFFDRIFNLPAYLGSYDYLFMPSLFEGLALTPIEAAFAGTPAIINDAPGLAEVFPPDWPLKIKDNNINGYIALFERLSLLNYAELKSKALSFVAERFTLKSMQQNYENLYYEILR